MLFRDRNVKAFGHTIWLVIALFSIPTIVYAASYVLESEELLV